MGSAGGILTRVAKTSAWIRRKGGASRGVHRVWRTGRRTIPRAETQSTTIISVHFATPPEDMIESEIKQIDFQIVFGNKNYNIVNKTQ
jgi:23S rRNA-/tRNA-specific pseudouridylate synthase